MESIKQISRIGHGPSSSHTMGPMRAARMFLERNRGAVRFNVTLYGSLAATGKGHMTDAAILEVLSPVAKTDITWEPKVFLPFHPNGILFQSFDESGEELDNWTIYSIGGGTLANETYNELTQVRKNRPFLLGICRTVRRTADMGLSDRSMGSDAAGSP